MAKLEKKLTVDQSVTVSEVSFNYSLTPDTNTANINLRCAKDESGNIVRLNIRPESMTKEEQASFVAEVNDAIANSKTAKAFIKRVYGF